MSTNYRRHVAVPLLALVAGISQAYADDEAAAASAPKSWWDSVVYSAQIDSGFTFNRDNADDNVNFGRLTDDATNQFLLNQVLLTAKRDLDTAAYDCGCYDIGFKLQALYGSDARITHFLGEFDQTLNDRNQLDIVEANIQLHTPWLTKRGIDFKLGQYSTPVGNEVIDPAGNFFYSHNYIFNFGVPYKHTGLLAIAHVTDKLDIYAGVDSGTNTSLSANAGDNNASPAGLAGFALNGLFSGKLNLIALSHFGPENPDDDDNFRYYNDFIATWKITDSLTSVTELNYSRDEATTAEAGGISEYLLYAVNDWLSVGSRAEVFFDKDAFYVGAFPNDQDFIDFLGGRPNSAYGGGSTTYGELTFGANIRPPAPGFMKGLVIRPEIRFDTSLNGTRPFATGTNSSQMTIASDIIIPFTL